MAAEDFEKAAFYKIPIDDYVYYYWAESLYKLGQLANSQKKLAAFLEKFPQSPLIEKGLSLFWETSLAINEPQAILDSLKFSLSYSDNPDALFYLAQAQESLGQTRQALQHYQRLYYFFPLYAKNSIVYRKLSTLLENNPEIPKSETPDAWKVTRIQKLFSAKRYEETLNDLEMLFQSNPSLATTSQFQLWLGISQFGSGRYFDAIQTLKGINSSDAEISAQAWFYIAESYRKLDNYSSFKQSVEILERRFATSRWLEEGLFSIGNYNLVRRNLEESTTFYQKILELFPNGAHVKDCHWRISWRYYRLKDYKRALEMFIEHLNRFEDSPHYAAALYWAARCKENLGQKAEAYQIYQAVRQKFANNYYGQLAKKHIAPSNVLIKSSQGIDPRLKKIIRALQSSSKSTNGTELSELQATSYEAWPRVKAFALIHLSELAGSELMRRQVYGDSPAIYFQAAQLFHRGKNFLQAIINLRRVFPNYLERSFPSLPRTIWEMFFPINFDSVVFREAQKQKVDPYLVLALIRQESTFDPNALSRANAYGLMQLLPSTARVVAREMKLQRPTPAHLYDPELNIRLGTKHFGDLLQKFNGQEDKALASYNAGVERVESWASEGEFADGAEFVETIPFSETRNYIKIIHRNYWFYKTLYGQIKDQQIGDRGQKIRHRRQKIEG